VTAATRVSRGAAGRRRRAGALIAGVALVAAGVYGVSRLGDAAGNNSGGPNGNGISTKASELLILQVVGTEDPLIALIGTGRAERRPAFFSLPFDLTLTVPGQGEVMAGEVAGLDAQTVRVAVSNTFGAWAEHVAVVDLEGLSSIVDRVKGIRVEVPGFYVTDAGNLGPGSARLTGEQVVALISLQGDGAEARWASVVQGLLRGRVRVGEEDLAQTNGIAGVRRVLKGAHGAAIAAFPTLSVAGSVTVPMQPDLDRQVARLFGFRSPVPVIVQNGAGAPGLGQDVAAVLLPLGFRVVLSGNADLFGYERTRVVANSNRAIADARRIREALGVGRVGVSQVPSGIGDITIIVGEDFTG
jgi:LytR cell envelope-related transcriptional attenuator/cell envelope-related transcriptional attenuator-like protein